MPKRPTWSGRRMDVLRCSQEPLLLQAQASVQPSGLNRVVYSLMDRHLSTVPVQ